MANITSQATYEAEEYEFQWLVNGLFMIDQIHTLAKIYFLPVGLVLNYLNNNIIIFILLFGKFTVPKLLKTLRIYYLAIAMLDQVVTFGVQLSYYIGMELMFQLGRVGQPELLQKYCTRDVPVQM